MNYLRQHYHNWSVFRKIVTWMMVVSMLPLCVMVMFDVAKIIDMETSNTQSEIVNGLQWIENDISEEIAELRLQAIRISLNETIQAELESKKGFAQMNLYEMKKSLFNISLSNQCHSAYILNQDGLQISNYASADLDAMMMERMPQFCDQLEKTKKTFVWGEPLKLGSTYLLPYIRSIETETGDKNANLFIANYPESSLAKITRDTMKSKTIEVENVLIINDGVIISSWNKELIGEDITKITQQSIDSSFQDKYRDEKCMFLPYKNETSSDWDYLAIASLQSIHASSYSIILLFIFISALCAVFIIIVSLFVSHSISKPLQYLSGAMQQIGDSGDLDIALKYPAYNDEVGKMWRCMIDMTARLKKSIAESKKALEQNQRLRIETLKAQINPHFLYNTFGTIIYLIEQGKRNEATEMLTALSELLHISISRSTDYIQVEQELGLIRRYMDIQKIRYQERFSYLIDVDMDIMKIRIVKIVLQPIVENALEYGVKKNPGIQALISIRGWREEDLIIFEVADNCGMLTERRMNEVNARLQSEEPAPEAKAGIGLKNVNDRICYAYPEDTRVGVRLLKRNGKTVTRVTLKVMEEQTDGTI